MPLSKYNQAFGGKEDAAEKAYAAVTEQYGAKKGQQVFYATKNKRMHAPRMKRKGRGN